MFRLQVHHPGAEPATIVSTYGPPASARIAGELVQRGVIPDEDYDDTRRQIASLSLGSDAVFGYQRPRSEPYYTVRRERNAS